MCRAVRQRERGLDDETDLTEYATFSPGGCGTFEPTAAKWIGVTYVLLRAGTRS